MKTSAILNFGFAKKAQFSSIPHNFSRGIQKSWSQDPGTTSWGSNEKTYFTFLYDFISLTSLLLPKWSGDLKYGPCPPARDFGSRVSGLVKFKFVHTAF